MYLKSIFTLIFVLTFAVSAFAQTSELDEIKGKVGIAFQKNDTTALYKLLDEAIEKFPKEGFFYAMRGMTRSEFMYLTSNGFLKMPNENYHAAVKDLEKAVQLLKVSESSVFIGALMGVHYMYQQYPQAQKTAQKLMDLANKQEDEEMYFGSQIISLTYYLKTGKVKEGKLIALDMLNKFSKRKGVYNDVGLFYGEIGEFEKAYDCFEKGMKIPETDNDNKSLQVNLGYVLNLAGKYQEALKVFESLSEEEIKKHEKGKTSAYYNNRGYAKMGLGNLQEAMQDINKALEYYPENSYALKNRGLLYLKMDKKDLACQDFQMAEKYGFSLTYGNEVLKLIKANCKK